MTLHEHISGWCISLSRQYHAWSAKLITTTRAPWKTHQFIINKSRHFLVAESRPGMYFYDLQAQRHWSVIIILRCQYPSFLTDCPIVCLYEPSGCINAEFCINPCPRLINTFSSLSPHDTLQSIPTLAQVWLNWSLISFASINVLSFKKCFRHQSFLPHLLSDAEISWYDRTAFRIVRWSPLACRNFRRASVAASRCSVMSRKSLEDEERTEMISRTSRVQPYSFDASTARA